MNYLYIPIQLSGGEGQDFGIFFFYVQFIFIYLFIGCVGSLLLHVGFLYLQQAGATLCCVAQVSLSCGTGSRHVGFSSSGMQASVVVAHGL